MREGCAILCNPLLIIVSSLYSRIGNIEFWRCHASAMAFGQRCLFGLVFFCQDTDFANFIKRIGVFLIFALMLEVKNCVRGFGGDEFFEFERFAN